MIVSKLTFWPSRIMLLGHAQHVRRLAAILAASAFASSIRVAAGTTRLMSPQDSAVVRVDRVAGEEQFGGAGMADDARQDPRTAVAGHQADLEERRAEDRIVGGDAHVGEASDIVAEADRRTVDRRDQRHFECPRALHDAVDAVAIPLADMHAGTGEAAGAFAHRFDVAAGRERRTRAGQNGAAHLAVGVDAAQRLGEQLAVALLAQADCGSRRRLIVSVTTGPVFLEQQGGHGVLPDYAALSVPMPR